MTTRGNKGRWLGALLIVGILLAAEAARAADGPIRFEPVGPSPAPKRSATPMRRQTPPAAVRPGLVPVRPRQGSPKAPRALAPIRRATGPVDERPFWNLLHARRYAALRRAIAMQRAARPGWHPPAQLLTLMHDDEVTGEVHAAMARNDNNRILALAAQSPTSFEPIHLDARWAWIGALAAQHRTEEALALVLATLDAPLAERERLATLQKAGGWLGYSGQASLINLELGRTRSPAFARQLTELLVDSRLAHLGAALQAHDDATASGLALELTPEIERRQDARLAVALGWLERRRGATAAARAWFERAVSWATGRPDAIAALAQAGEVEAARRLLPTVAINDPRRAGIDRAIALGTANRAYQEKRPEAALAALAQAGNLGLLPPEAEVLRVRALLQLGRVDEASQYAQALAGTPAHASALAAVALWRANNAYTARRYADARKYLEEAQGLGDRSADTRLLMAWTLYNSGDAAAAAPEFAAVFDERPDSQAAEGLYLSATRAGRTDLLEKRQDHPAFARVLTEQKARAAFGEGHFALAQAAAPGLYPDLARYGWPSVAVGLSRRDRTGDAGLSRLQVTRSPVSDVRFAITPADEAHVSVDRLVLDSGTPGQNAVIGSAPAGAATPALAFASQQAVGIQPHVRYQHLGKNGLNAEIGITPTGGPLPSAWTGELGYDASDTLGMTSLNLFSRPVPDSRLSLIGMTDPYAGTSWGRVTSVGVALGRSLAIGLEDNLAGKLQVDALSGDGVADNDHTAISIGWRRQLTNPALSYAAWGVDGVLDTYRRNLAGFTLGNGGYFSPQLQGRLRLAIDARTEELKPFMLSASVGVGPGHVWVDSAPYFPLNPDGRNYPGYERTTVYYDADFRAVARLTDWAQGGCDITIYRNADYEEHVISLFTRILLGPRPSVVSSDLTVAPPAP